MYFYLDFASPLFVFRVGFRLFPESVHDLEIILREFLSSRFHLLLDVAKAPYEFLVAVMKGNSRIEFQET